MGNIVDIQITSEKVIFKVPRKNIVTEIDNVAYFDSKTKKLISTGIAQKTFQENYPKKWMKYKDSLELRPIFDSTSYSPEVAAMFLWELWNEMTRQGAAGQIVLRSQAKLEINISFDHYEDVPLEKQQDFEYLVFRYLYAKRLIINGSEKHWDKSNNISAWLFSVLYYVFVITFGLLSIFLVPLLMSIVLTAEIPSLLIILLFILMLGGLYVLMLVGDFTFKLLWILCMKPFFLKRTLIHVLEYQINFPQKRNSTKSTSFLINWLLAENQ